MLEGAVRNYCPPCWKLVGCFLAGVKGAHKPDMSAPWLCVFKELEAQVPRSSSEKAKLMGMW